MGRRLKLYTMPREFSIKRVSILLRLNPVFAQKVLQDPHWVVKVLRVTIFIASLYQGA